ARRRLWDVDTGKAIAEVPVGMATFSPDGRRLVVFTWDTEQHVADKRLEPVGERLVLLDADTGKQITSVPGVFDHLAFSANGKRFTALKHANRKDPVARNIMGDIPQVDPLTGVWYSLPKEIEVWDADNGAEVATLTCDLRGAYLSPLRTLHGLLSLSPDGTRLATLGRELVVWDVASAKELFRLKGHSTVVTSVAFTADGKRLASVSGGLAVGGKTPTEVKLWDTAAGKELLNLTFQWNTIPMDEMVISFGRDGTRLLVQADSRRRYPSTGILQVWDATPLPEKR